MISAARADIRGWGPGWPNCQSGNLVAVKPQGHTRVQLVRAEIAPIVQYAFDQTQALGYELHDGWCWSFSCRPIRGSNEPSNHSWGLAVDLNAPTNGLGAPSGDLQQHPDVVALWKSLGFRWGGDYTGRKDWMHFEFMGEPSDALHIAGLLGSTPVPDAPSGTPVPPQRHVPPNMGVRLLYDATPNMKGEDVRGLQLALNFVTGANLKEDGELGPATSAAIKSFQRFFKLRVDGIAGKNTKALLGFLYAIKE